MNKERVLVFTLLLVAVVGLATQAGANEQHQLALPIVWNGGPVSPTPTNSPSNTPTSTVTPTPTETSTPTSNVIYVKYDVDGNDDGSSWTDAYVDLQDALGVAEAGDEIWVAEGVYYPAPDALERTATFELQNGVQLYGGFAGTETEREQRAWETNVTVLSGDLDRNDTTDENGVVTDTIGIVGRNAYHVISADGVGNTTELHGFVVTAGLADGVDEEQRRGGGVYLQSASLTIANVTLNGNWAVMGGGMYNCYSNPRLADVILSRNEAEYGGGMDSRGGSPTLTSVTFTNNNARYTGGGLRSIGGNLTLTNVTFGGNYATSRGGGMNNTSMSSAKLTHVTFSCNQSSQGGGMFNVSSSAELTNVIFSANDATVRAGGMGNMYGSSTLSSVVFRDNEAGSGGGLHNWDNSNLTLTNIAFTGNQASSEGGGMGSEYSSATLNNVTFSGNYADQNGGGLSNGPGDITLGNTTFGGNNAESMGGAIHNDNSSPVLANCILWGNEAPTGPQIHNEGTSAPYVMYSAIQGDYSGDGNVDGDPLFVNPVPANQAPTTAGDYRLTEGSPAMDAGTNDVVTVDTDLDGNPRIIDGDGDGYAIVDMGAYEFQAP